MVRVEMDFRPIQAQLDKLSDEVAKKAVKHGVRLGNNIILRRCRMNAKLFIGGRLGARMAINMMVAPQRKQPPVGYAAVVKLTGVKQFISALRRHMGAPAGSVYRGKVSDVFVHKTKHTFDNKGKPIRYFIPAAVEYGHAFPGGGGTKRKDVRAIPALTEAAKMEAERAFAALRKSVERAVAKLSTGVRP